MLCLSRNGLLPGAGADPTSLRRGLRPCAAHLLNGGDSRTTTALPSSAVDLPVRSLPFIFFGKPGVSIDASRSSSLRSVVRSTWAPPPLSQGMRLLRGRHLTQIGPDTRGATSQRSGRDRPGALRLRLDTRAMEELPAASSQTYADVLRIPGLVTRQAERETRRLRWGSAGGSGRSEKRRVGK